MVRVLIGDMFKSKAQTLVNTVNIVGIMGKGIALEFKQRFPDMFEDYKRRCDAGEVKLGEPYIFRTEKGPWIINFPTKDHWRSVSRLSDIEKGLQFLEHHYKRWGIQSIAVPPLGCGNGELEWRVVGPTLFRYLKLLDIPVELYAPYGTPEGELTIEFLSTGSPERTSSNIYQERLDSAWIALVEILDRVQREPYHWPVGRTIFQKMAFVATNEGLPTGMIFRRGTYGPYSGDLRRHQARLVNNGLIIEEQKGRMMSIRTGSTYPDAKRIYSKDIDRWDRLITKVADLFNRLTTDEAEIIATIIYSATELRQKDKCYTEAQLLESVMEWKQRKKPPLDRIDVATKIRNLGALGWLDAKPSKDMAINDLI
jgi:uncharacterized protein YwgA/O-acetyl-ADP-ribose deacetylase (regulator of RNase III)